MTNEHLAIDLEFAKAFAEEWVAAWNAHDLNRVLSHYTEDFEFSSPVIIALGFGSSGRLRGKAAIRPYWSAGLARQPPIRFELVEAFAGIDSVTLFYRSVGRKLACETFFFDGERNVIRSLATYGRPV
jgi:hypothetical protein